MDIRIRIWKK